MSVDAHRTSGPRGIRCSVLTISDTRDAQTDTSGRAIADLLQQSGHAVADHRIAKDEPVEVAAAVRSFLTRDDVHAIVTTGGTGIARRDNTYDALAAMFERTLPGFGELFRALSYAEIGAAAMLTRATAGIVDRRVVFLLPGSEHAVRLAMTKLILPELGHVVRELRR
ncbi:MAG TPA: MogA/MoaB family molybdenum cofactor biosynthesis protein [Vicinamibacterales bacterium]|jgi:molybdenum cofactor biosynthesis protein B|nr:MogA/MoaB family molybdenum cofactor biosynthesis protein [Vicinamibacterales bacterium]